MKKRTLSILLYVFVFQLLLYPVKAFGSEDIFTVVLDAGHGGKDHGASGKNAHEKDIALAITLKTGEYIEKNLKNVKVVYTRKTDVFPGLKERAEIANKNKAQLIISIHVNSNPSPKPYGASTHVFGLSQADDNFEVAKRENSVILLEDDYETKYQDFDPNSPESFIIFSVMQDTYFNQSLEMAKFVQDQFRNRAGRNDRGVKQQPLYVLAQSSMPGVLIETGFISNPKEELYLISKNGQDYIASAIFRAFRDYKNIIESNNIIASKTIDKNDITTVNDYENDTENVIIEKSLDQQKEIVKPENKGQISPGPDIMPENEKDLDADTVIVFSVQISSSYARLKSNSDYFKGMDNIQVYQSDGLFKYTTGREEAYDKIKKHLEKVKKHFPDAFIVAVKKGEIISLKQAFNETSLKNNNIN